LLPGPSATTYWLCCPSVAAWTVGDDVLGLLPEDRQLVEDIVRIGELHRLDAGYGLLRPLRGRMLGVAVGERDGVPLLVQPGGQVDGECRFADPALGICDNDNHATDHTPAAGMLASNMCSKLT
jgi:hypothetical protein